MISRAIAAILFLALPAFAAEHPERWYQERVSAALKGKMEVHVPDGRVDVVTETHAIEVEFSSKWKNSLGQALWYALQTGKQAGIVLILEDEQRDSPDAIRLGSVIETSKLPIKLWLWPRDFQSRCVN